MTTYDDPDSDPGRLGVPTQRKDIGLPGCGQPGSPGGSRRAAHPKATAEMSGAVSAFGEFDSDQPSTARPESNAYKSGSEKQSGVQPEAVSARNETNATVAQYRDIAVAAMSDAEMWLRQGALSRAIPEAIPDAIVIVDEAGTIILVNSATELMFGYHRSEVIGNPVEMLLPESVRARHVDHRRVFSEEPRVRTMGESLVLNARRKNGGEFRVRVKLGPVVTPAGMYTIAVIRTVRE
jgi:PAS domain S-box-containing protein